MVHNADLQENVGQKMEDESGHLHKDKGMQKSLVSEKTGNSPYTYNCDELYMVSPLEKKQRTGSVNYHTGHGLLCALYWLLLDSKQLLGEGSHMGERIRRFGRRNRRIEVQTRLSVNSGDSKTGRCDDLNEREEEF